MGKVRRRRLYRERMRAKLLKTENLVGKPAVTAEKPRKSRAKKRNRKQRRTREVTPTWRSKYGCGRLHWNMRNHGKIDVRRKKRTNKTQTRPAVAPVEDHPTPLSATTLVPAEPKRPVEIVLPHKVEERMETNVTGLPTEAMVDVGTSESHQISECKMSVINSSTRYSLRSQNSNTSISSSLLNSSVSKSVKLPIEMEVSTERESTMEVESAATRSRPPVYPWKENLNNNRSKDSAIMRTISEPRSRGLPARKCALYATIKIHKLYARKQQRCR